MSCQLFTLSFYVFGLLSLDVDVKRWHWWWWYCIILADNDTHTCVCLSCIQEQQTSLHIASRLGHVADTILLLQHGASADAVTRDLYTSLHIACKEGHLKIVQTLLEFGANTSLMTKVNQIWPSQWYIFTKFLSQFFGRMKQKDKEINIVRPYHISRFTRPLKEDLS